VTVLLLACPDFSQVELQLLALQNVTVSATGLPRSAGDCGIQTTRTELRFKERVDLRLLLPLVKLTLCVVRQFFIFGHGSWLLRLDVLLGYRLGVVRFVPLAVWCSINQNDGALDESVRADKLVVRGIVDHTDDSRFLRDML